MSDPTLDEIAAALIALPLADFTRERNARAAALSDERTADAVRALRKPSAAAWVADLLVRARPDALQEALALAEAMREAQDELDAATLAELTKQRRALVAGLAREAVRLAAEAGVTVSRPVQEDVEKTLNAAMRDADAAAALMTGRIVRPLEVVGFDPVDLDGAVAGTSPGREPAAPRDDLAERRARREAERAARAAEQAAGEAERLAARSDAAAARARERADQLAERVESLRRDLADAEAAAVAAESAARTAEDERAEAARAAKHAASRASAARVAADDAGAD